MMQLRKFIVWLLLALLAAMASYTAFRGYLSPEFLIDFSNAFVC